MRPPLSLSSPDGWKLTINEEESGMTVTVERGLLRMARFVGPDDALRIYGWLGDVLGWPAKEWPGEPH